MSAASIYEGQTTLIPVVNALGNVFEEWQIATAGQTLFTLASFQYTPGTNTLLVFKNGLFQRVGFDYTETNSAHVTFLTPLALNDRVAFFAWATLGTAIPNGGGVPAGGSAGQILSKIDGSDYNTQWIASSALAGLLDKPIANLASANTVDVSALSGTTRNIAITGTTNIAGFQITNGQLFAVRFTGSLTLVNSASLATNRNANLAVSPGDTCFIRATADNIVEVLAYSGATNLSNAYNYTFRNKIVNGECYVNQRQSGVVTLNGGFPLDMWNVFFPNAGTMTSQVLNNIFNGLLGAVRMTAVGSTAAAVGSFWVASTKAEGFSCKDMQWGTANAQPITVSFRVRCTVAGTYAISIRNQALTRTYIATFTQNVANADEYKTITIPGDTAGAWNVDNTTGFNLTFCAGCGSGNALTPGAWSAINGLGAVGQSNMMLTNGATMDIGGVQVELGTQATAFEKIPFEIQLKRVRRYFETTYPYGTIIGSTSSDGQSRAFAFDANTLVNITPQPWREEKRSITGLTVQCYNPITGVAGAVRSTSSGGSVALTNIVSPGVNNFNQMTSAGGFVAGQWYEYQLAITSELP